MSRPWPFLKFMCSTTRPGSQQHFVMPSYLPSHQDEVWMKISGLRLGSVSVSNWRWDWSWFFLSCRLLLLRELRARGHLVRRKWRSGWIGFWIEINLTMVAGLLHIAVKLPVFLISASMVLAGRIGPFLEDIAWDIPRRSLTHETQWLVRSWCWRACWVMFGATSFYQMLPDLDGL